MLPKLPTELLLCITSHLSVPERQILRGTCTRFYYLLPPPSLDDLKDIMYSVYNYKYYCLCHPCAKLSPKNEGVDPLCGLIPRPAEAYKPNHGVCGRCTICDTWLPSGLRQPDFEQRRAKRKEEEESLLALRKQQGLGKAFWEEANGFRWRGYVAPKTVEVISLVGKPRPKRCLMPTSEKPRDVNYAKNAC